LGQGVRAVHAVEYGRVVESRAAAHYRLVVKRIGEAEARPEVRAVGLAQRVELRLYAAVGLSIGGNYRAEATARGRVRNRRVEAAERAVRLSAEARQIVAKARVDGQTLRDFDVVLKEVGVRELPPRRA